MKLLFDQNLSHKLAVRLADTYPGSTHVRNVGLKTADDPVVWDYAKQNGFAVVSKDADFHQRSLVLGYPPKVIWIRLGNCSTREVEELLQRYVEEVATFLEGEAAFLSLSL